MTTERTKTHNPTEISITFGDYPINSGRAEEFCVSEYTEELYTMVPDAEGNITRVKSANRSATVKLKLLRTSDAHRTLTQLYLTAGDAPNGQDIAPLYIRDRNGGLVEHGEEAWISKPPPLAHGKAPGEVEWEFMVARLIRDVE